MCVRCIVLYSSSFMHMASCGMMHKNDDNKNNTAKPLYSGYFKNFDTRLLMIDFEVSTIQRLFYMQSNLSGPTKAVRPSVMEIEVFTTKGFCYKLEVSLCTYCIQCTQYVHTVYTYSNNNNLLL